MADRRTVIKGLAALPLAAAPAVAQPALAGTTSNLAASLMAEFKQFAHETAVASAKMDAAEERMEWISPPEELFCRDDDPAVLRWPCADVDWRTKRPWWGNPERLQGLRDNDYKRYDSDLNRRAASRLDEIVAANDGWLAERERAAERCGFIAARDEWRVIAERYEAFRLRLIHMRTTDLGVIAVKAAVVAERYDYLDDVTFIDGAIGRHLKEQDDEEALSFSIVRDFALRADSAA